MAEITALREHLVRHWGCRAARPCIFNLRTFRQSLAAGSIPTTTPVSLSCTTILEVESLPLAALTYISASWIELATTTTTTIGAPVETCHRVKYRKRPEKTVVMPIRDADAPRRAGKANPRETSRRAATLDARKCFSIRRKLGNPISAISRSASKYFIAMPPRRAREANRLDIPQQSSLAIECNCVFSGLCVKIVRFSS